MPASPDDEIMIRMSRREALALEKLAEIGLTASAAFNLVPNTASGEHGLSLLRRAMADDQTQKSRRPR